MIVKRIKLVLFVSVLFYFFSYSILSVYAATTYDFESDTIGSTPSGVTVTAGTFDVQNQATLGKSMRAVTQVGVIAGVIFSNFASSSDQSVVWKQAYSSNLGRGGFTLRAQDTDTGTINSVGAKQGYLFHVYETGAVYIWKVGPSNYTALWSGSLTKAEPRWFRALAMGNQLGFYYSNNGTTYTLLSSTTDSTYTSGKVQYTAGYGSSVNFDYVDDIVITNLDVDNTPPTISSLSPSDNATSINPTSNLVMTFNEAVDAKVGNINIYKSSDDSLVEAIDVAGGKVTGSGTSVITINPATDLAESTDYYAQVDATAFDDTAGNSYAGISGKTNWNFTTGDFTNPSASTFSPSDNATGIALNTNLILTFNESVTIGSGNISIYKSIDDSLVESININSGQVSGTGTNIITVNPTSDLDYGTQYYIHIDITALDDLAGNSFSGIVDNTSWNFSTIENQTQRSSRSGSSISNRFNNLVRMGNTDLANELVNQYPNLNNIQPITLNNCKIGDIERVLRSGSQGEDVRNLQKFLNCSGFILSSTGPGSPGNETTLFSVKTYIALKKFQEQHSSEILAPLNLTQGTGVFGELSRKKASGLK